MDIRKPFLKSFTVKELMQFIDYYIEHKEMLHVPGHPWEVCDLVARFLGLGYSRQWAEDETAMDDYISQADAVSETVQPAKAEAEAQNVEEADEGQPEEHTFDQFEMTHM